SPEWSVVTGTWPNAIDMNQHIVEYGRMFNEIDDELARNVCVIGTNIRDQLFGAPDEGGRENVVGEYISINDQPFRIIGVFQRYESEQDRKKREMDKNKPKEKVAGVQRRRGWGGRGPGGWVYNMKNSTIYMPLNTM